MRFLGAFILFSAASFAAEYTIDSAHSSAVFSVRHMMVSNVKGQFSKMTGKVSYDPKHVATTKVEATIEVASIDTREPKRDAHLKSSDFFDLEKFPTMSFRSTKAWKEGDRIKLAGDLTIHGVTKAVTFDLETPSPEVKMPDGARTGASATAVISRKDFGLTWNKLIESGGAVVGDTVSITLDIEATRE